MFSSCNFGPSYLSVELLSFRDARVFRYRPGDLSFSPHIASTSRDWVTYPILRFKDTPKVTTVLVNRPDRTASGSGEPPLVPSGAAIANAIYDAVGVRINVSPITSERVYAALQEKGES